MADCEIGQCATAKFGGRLAGLPLERAIKRTDRSPAGVQGDGEDRDARLRRVGQRLPRLFQPVLVDEISEVPIAEALVDRSPKTIFRDSQLLGQPIHRELWVAVGAILLHRPP